MAGCFALVEYDLKKIIAFSTLSQLGLIVLALGLGSTLAAFFHLLMHAIFKAIIFLVGGIVLGVSFGAQSLRFLKGSLLKHPFYLSVFVVATLNLVAVPFMRAYFSKHLILELFTTNPKVGLRIVLGFLRFITTWAYAGRTLHYLIRRVTPSLALKNNRIYVLVPLSVLVTLAIIWGHSITSILLSSPGLLSPQWLSISITGFAILSFLPVIIAKRQVIPSLTSIAYLTPFNKAAAGLLQHVPNLLRRDVVILSPGSWGVSLRAMIGWSFVKWLSHMKMSFGILLLCTLLFTF